MEQPDGSQDDFVLRNILANLTHQDHLLLELRCFGTSLKTLVDALLRDRFLEQWGISDISGSPPPSPTAFTSCRLANFYRLHLVIAGESLSTIALKHGTDVSTLRRVNNIITDHTLASRTEVYVPVQDASLVQGCNVSFEYHRAAHNRPMFVLRPACDNLNDDAASSNASSVVAAPTSNCNTQKTKSNKSNILLQKMLERTLAIDATTAGYYLAASVGDPRAAIAAYQEDQRWDAKMRHLKRSLGSKKQSKCK